MQKCWHPDPNKRPPVTDLEYKIRKLLLEDPCKIMKSPDIGPITNNPHAIYKSKTFKNLISQNITLEF
ncbi:hypothetical protein GLOIN_2v1736661, partial [Rhizophagus irregularis DAOM 181602=DAOM 197198]